MQPIKEFSSAAERCAGRDCALIRQLANTEFQKLVSKLHIHVYLTSE